jgi:hypothetical protein
VIIIPHPEAGVKDPPSEEEFLSTVKEMIGDDSLPVKILDTSQWTINETVAEKFSDGNV